MKIVELNGKEELLIEFVELLNYEEGIVEDYFRKLIEIGKLIKTCTDDNFKWIHRSKLTPLPEG